MVAEQQQSRQELERLLREARERVAELESQLAHAEEADAQQCVQQGTDLRIFDWLLQPMACLELRDKHLCYVQVNEAFAELAGGEASALQGRRHEDVFPDAGLLELLQEAQAEQRQVQARALPLAGFGSEASFWDVAVLPVKGNDHCEASWLALSLTDVGEYVRTREALSERELRLRSLIDAMPDIVCFKDGQGRWVEANDADLELFGLKGVDYRGKTDAELADHTLPVFREAFMTCLETDEAAWQLGVLSRKEECIPLSGGGSRTFDVIKLPLFRDDGSRKGLVVVGRDITERKQAEEALLESEERHALVLVGANDGIWDWNRRTDEVFFSARWKEIIGYQDHEIQNDINEWLERIHTEDRERVLQANNRLFCSDDDQFEVEYRLRHKDGSYRWILGRGACQRGADGKPERMAGAHTDITELKRVEEELRLSMQRFRALFDNAIMGIALHELVRDESGCPVDYRIANVNRSYTRILGLELEAVEGRLGSEAYGQEEPPFLETYAQVVESGKPSLFEAPYTEWGKVFRIVAFPTGEGAFATMFEDISESRRAEEQLREAMDRLAFHVDNSPLAVIEWRDGTHIENWSSRAESIFGWSAEEVLGKNWGDFPLVHPDDEEKVTQEVMRLFRGEEVYNISKNRNLRKDGSVVHCHWFNSALRDASGNMISILSQVADITELVETTAQLRDAKESAEAASMAKSQFLATMSHEIRTPMNVIVGMAEMFRHTPLTQEQRQYLNILETSSETLLTLLGDVLDISKVEAGQLQLEAIPFRLADVVATVANVLGSRASEKGLELVVDVAPEVPQVLVGDPNRLRQVLVNLVSNAVKFTPAGEVRLLLRPDPDANPPDGDSAQFALRCDVRDTGIGIRSGDLERIFDQFTQADSSITREYGGTGLGLTICRNLVQLMGGQLWVNSEEGQGSEFHFTASLQRPQGEEAQAAAALQTVSQPEACSEAQGEALPLRILLVEDSDYNAYVVLAFLKNANCIIDIAKNGEEGLERFRGNSYDLVLMDMRMPVMDGYSASQAIRQWERENDAQRTPIVAMTAQAFMEDRKRSLEAGCDEHLAKPVRRQDLLGLIESFAPGCLHASGLENGGNGRSAAEDSALSYPFHGPIHVTMDPELAHVVPRYLESLQQEAAELRQMLDVGDLRAVAEAGHRMKGEGQAFGLEPVSVLGASLQQAGVGGDLRTAKALLERLEDYLSRVELG